MKVSISIKRNLRCDRCKKIKGNVLFNIHHNLYWCTDCIKNTKWSNFKILSKGNKMGDYYIYAWKDRITGEVYYVGKGHNKRLHQRRVDKDLNKLREEGRIIICKLEEHICFEKDAYDREAYYTRYYKKLGQAKYNKVIGRGLKE